MSEDVINSLLMEGKPIAKNQKILATLNDW